MPGCNCAVRSTESRVFTCPVCVGKALLMMNRLGAQMDLFEEGGCVSVSALIGCDLSERDRLSVEPVVIRDDGLPF